MFADPSHQTEDVRDTFTSALLPMLMNTPALRILSKLQRTLDCLDIEGLSNLWRHAEASAPLYRTTFASFFERGPGNAEEAPPSSPIGVSSLFLTSPEPTISDWTDFLDTYLSSASSHFDNSNPGRENLRYYLLAYLLSATFKDCSIIIRLDPLQPTIPQPAQVKPERVTVIDLDPKSMDRLRKWEKLDREIVLAYLGVEERKVCVDGWVE
jgi:inositol-pentakisphosphate 2-kinase